MQNGKRIRELMDNMIRLAKASDGVDCSKTDEVYARVIAKIGLINSDGKTVRQFDEVSEAIKNEANCLELQKECEARWEKLFRTAADNLTDFEKKLYYEWGVSKIFENSFRQAHDNELTGCEHSIPAITEQMRSRVTEIEKEIAEVIPFFENRNYQYRDYYSSKYNDKIKRIYEKENVNLYGDVTNEFMILYRIAKKTCQSNDTAIEFVNSRMSSVESVMNKGLTLVNEALADMADVYAQVFSIFPKVWVQELSVKAATVLYTARQGERKEKVGGLTGRFIIQRLRLMLWIECVLSNMGIDCMGIAFGDQLLFLMLKRILRVSSLHEAMEELNKKYKELKSIRFNLESNSVGNEDEEENLAEEILRIEKEIDEQIIIETKKMLSNMNHLAIRFEADGEKLCKDYSTEAQRFELSTNLYFEKREDEEEQKEDQGREEERQRYSVETFIAIIENSLQYHDSYGVYNLFKITNEIEGILRECYDIDHPPKKSYW